MRAIVGRIRDFGVVSCLGVLITQASAAANPLGVNDAAQRCTALTQQVGATLGEATARVTTAQLNPRSEAKIDPAAPPWLAGVPAMPEHCEVIGVMRERVGSDGQHYAVKYHVRLPTDWNGRFLFQGGGGTNGMLGNATGPVQPGIPTALEMGYAVVSTDTGHDNAINSNPALQGTVAFGHDYEARVEYAEKAIDSVAGVAKRIVTAFYGRSARHNYFVGCSNGGREGMVFAQRFPEQFDGIVAGAPAFAVPKAAVAEAWDTQVFAALAKHMKLTNNSGLPDIARTFSQGDLKIVAETIAQVCDADDGIADGMVQNLFQCTTPRVRPALETHVCVHEKEATCLSREQVDTLVRSLDGPRNSKGESLYPGWPWDIGIADMGWRIWKLGMPGGMESINVMLGSPAMSGLFVTPPATVAATSEANLRYQLEFNFDRDAPKLFSTSKEFPRSGWDLVGAQSSDLSRFRQRGGKMIVPHGGSDPIFSINDTVNWWRKLDAANHGKATDFVRVFAVPGMNHCGGGPATDQFNALAAIVEWVEAGRAPDHIEAKAGPNTPWPGRTRPLCPFPQIARYKTGDVNKSQSFTCELMQ
jgi:Tannase and feruloyl esterase